MFHCRYYEQLPTRNFKNSIIIGRYLLPVKAHSFIFLYNTIPRD